MVTVHPMSMLLPVGAVIMADRIVREMMGPGLEGMFVEVKVSREIRNDTGSMFFGLSTRQFIFSVSAAGVAVLLHFFLKPIVGFLNSTRNAARCPVRSICQGS